VLVGCAVGAAIALYLLIERTRLGAILMSQEIPRAMIGAPVLSRLAAPPESGAILLPATAVAIWCRLRPTSLKFLKQTRRSELLK